MKDIKRTKSEDILENLPEYKESSDRDSLTTNESNSSIDSSSKETNSIPSRGTLSTNDSILSINSNSPIEEIPGKYLAEKMLHVAKSTNLHAEDIDRSTRKELRNYRKNLANYIKHEVSEAELHTPIIYDNKQMSVTEFAARLNLGPDVLEVLIDRTKPSKEELKSIIKINNKNRNKERLSNYTTALGVIGGAALGGAADGFGEMPGGAILLGALGAVAGMAALAASPVGDTVAKNTKRMLTTHVKEFKEKHEQSNSANPKPNEIELQELNFKTKSTSQQNNNSNEVSQEQTHIDLKSSLSHRSNEVNQTPNLNSTHTNTKNHPVRTKYYNNFFK